MPVTITMPALSPTMESGTLAKWLVKEGDEVAIGDIIAEIETDKATMEVEAVDEGKVGKILVDAGATEVPVNEPIAILLEEGEDESALDEAATPAPAPAAKDDAAPKSDDKSGDKPAAAPAKADSNVAAGPAPTGSDGNRIFSSPLARRLAKLNDLDLSKISGTGPRGRIVKRDIDAALESGSAKAGAPEAKKEAAAPAPAAAAASSGSSDEQVLKMFDEGSYELVPHDGMRKTIAKRLTEAKQTIPHFYVSVDLEIDELLSLRKQLNSAAPMKDDKPVYKLSVNDMIIKAMAMALRDVPDANVSWTSDNMVKHKHVDVGVAVSIPGGLITPIIRKAEEKALSTISNEMKDLGKRAKERKLKPEEYQGGTTAVSNMGMMGVKNFSAVVNPPHSTILAIGAGEKRPIVKGDEIKIANMMSVTLSTDHRTVDGALGAQLLKAFKGYIENPMSLLV